MKRKKHDKLNEKYNLKGLNKKYRRNNDVETRLDNTNKTVHSKDNERKFYQEVGGEWAKTYQ